jgi:AraC family transcriptional regulator
LFDVEEESATPLARQALHNLSVPGLRPLADQLADELRHGGPYNVEAADCMAHLLLIQVSRHLRRAQDGTKALGASSMKRLNDYVLAHLDERIMVADLAREVGMSIDRFAWTCKMQTGQSPHQYLLALRLEQARHLLWHSSVAIAEVASACGFSNQQHLTTAMHRHAGVTPARHRKKSVSG